MKHFSRPVNLGQWDQSSSKTVEIAKRIIAGVCSIPALIAAPICTPLSVALQEIGAVLQPKPFHHAALSQPKDAPSLSSLSCFSLNVCGLWGGYPLVNGNVLPWKDRIASILSIIQEQNADVICLQEVHDPCLYGQLEAQLKKVGYEICDDIGRSLNPIKANSGLFVASKHPMKNLEFTPFNSGIGTGSFVNKGVFSFSLGNVVVMTTHLQHSKDDIHPTDEEKSIRKSQIAIIVEKIRQQNPQTPILLVGDLNLYGDEFSQTMSSDFYSDYMTRHPHDETWMGYALESMLWNQPIAKKVDDEPSFVIDHACIYRNEAFPSMAITTEKVSTQDPIPATDHHGLLTKISLETLNNSSFRSRDEFSTKSSFQTSLT